MSRRYRYNLTRICLTEGSFTIQKPLSVHFSTDGAVFCDDTGIEHHVSVMLKQQKIYGLQDFYKNRNLNVNDVLYLTPLEAGRFSLEVEIKGSASRSPSLPTQQNTTPAPQRVVLAESQFVREVRTERNIPQIKEVAAAVPPPSAKPRAETKTVPPTAPSNEDVALIQLFAERMGYQHKMLNSYTLLLETSLGTQSYKVLFTTAPDWQGLQAARSEYRALLVSQNKNIKVPAGLKVTLVPKSCLEGLIAAAQLYPITPVELRGYWNTDTFTEATVESVLELCNQNLGQRGVFSQVVLSLAEYPPNQHFKASVFAHRLQPLASYPAIMEILNILSKQPFLALVKISEDEYYLRQNAHELLEHLSDYAKGLQSRLRSVRSLASTPNTEKVKF